MNERLLEGGIICWKKHFSTILVFLSLIVVIVVTIVIVIVLRKDSDDKNSN